MSNLKLPRMTFDNLAPKARTDKRVKIAYATEIAWVTDKVVVYHHGNHIATLGKDFTLLTNAGWHSRTTANRLHTIAMDNGAGFGIGIKGGIMEVRPVGAKPRPMNRYETF